MNTKIKNEIQALIRIKERNNNGGDLREFICAREVEGYGEKTYLIAFDHYSICARIAGRRYSAPLRLAMPSMWIYGNTSWTANTSARQTRTHGSSGRTSGAITGEWRKAGHWGRILPLP